MKRKILIQAPFRKDGVTIIVEHPEELPSGLKDLMEKIKDWTKGKNQ